jgi:hypothetical protein
MSCNVAMDEAIQLRAEFDLMMHHHRASPMTVKKHFQPGESVPETAVYGVIHDGHRAIHHATPPERGAVSAVHQVQRPSAI